MFKRNIPHRLLASHTQLSWLVAPLRRKGQIQGEEKTRHADWLNQQATGVVLTDEQIAEIRHAIIEGRPHKAKKDEVYAQRAIMNGQPNALEATGSMAASSSGHIYPAAPTYAPPVPPAELLVVSQGINPVARGVVKRVRSGTRNLVQQNYIGASAQDPFLRLVQRREMRVCSDQIQSQYRRTSEA